MKIISLPDLHEKGTQHLESIKSELAAADLVLLVGDLTNNSPNIMQVVMAVQKYNPYMLAVPGNWDNDEADKGLSTFRINLHGRHEVIDGMVFHGAGGALAPGEKRVYTEEQYEAILQQSLDGVDETLPRILVTHQPPTGVLRIRALGSKAIRSFIEKTQPLICFCGHMHDARGIEAIGSTQVINPGPLYKGHYGYAEVVDGVVKALEVRKLPDWIDKPEFEI